jgi:exopolysaccharide biosynthesis polyprenyl glycosylphosphotransferase
VYNLMFFNVARRIIDFFAVIAGFACGYWYYFQTGRTVPYSLLGYLGFGAFAGLVFLIVFHSARLYERESSLLHVVEAKKLLVSSVFGSLLILGATFYFRFIDFSRMMLSASLLFAFFFLVIERSIFYRLSIFFHMQGRALRPSLIYGAGVVGRHLCKRVYHSPALGIRIVGFLDDDQALWGKDVKIREISSNGIYKVLGGLNELPELIKAKSIKEVFVSLPTASYQRNLEILQACKKLRLAVSVVPPTFGRQMHALEMQDIGGIPIIREKQSRPKIFYPMFKRVFDVFVSLGMLLVLSPIMVAIVVAIKLDSRGPAIFRQRRVGLNGKEFNFFKFRSMRVDANPYSFTPKVSQDPRITRFGRWLRRSSLDELPQLINVVRGEMSIVGPRPEMPFIVETYNEEQRERLKVKPGITGVWQISAVRGEPIHANMEYDLFYLEHRSFILDMIIMIKTLITAIRGIGAV